MTERWHQTNQISMSLQTAELRLAGIQQQPVLALSCHLVSIARGQCQLEIYEGDAKSGAIGAIEIDVSRPIMRARVALPPSLYESLSQRLINATPRRISLTLTLATQLAVSIEGDLRIDESMKLDILDLAATIPLY